MDGSSTKKSTSLETLIIQNISNVNDLKAKLHDIIRTGKDYEYDVSSCLKSLLRNSDQEIVFLSVQAISELAKCEDKRETYAQEDVIEPILTLLSKEVTTDNTELIKHCCRTLGNLCCDCDTSRKIINEQKGATVLINLLEKTLQDKSATMEEIKRFTIKTLLNYAIGGQEFSESIEQGGLVPQVYKILLSELEKEDMDDDMVSSCLLILSVINDNTPEFLFGPDVNLAVLNILRETSNVEISELCLDHLHAQAEHDSVKTLLATEGGVQLVCSRLEQLVRRYEAGELDADDTEVEAIMKQACDLFIIVLTGDEAMHILYKNGSGEVYTTMVKWLDSTNWHLLTAAVLAIGNFARQDDYCARMMDDEIFDKLLDVFEVYHNIGASIQKEPDKTHSLDTATVTKIQHAVLSAIRNLTVPSSNKHKAAMKGRAAPLLLNALPNIEDHHVAYKLLAALRMLVDGQEDVALQLASDPSALASVAVWGHAGQYAGAAGEAPRLIAWAAKQLPAGERARIVQVDGCISSLINMLVACHSVMQNEAILALTLLAIESLKTSDPTFDYEKSFITQLLKSEIGKHVSVLIETNCAKMPVEVAENLLAFLDMTSKKQELASDYREVKVQESLQKFMESRSDLSDGLKNCIAGVVTTISEHGKDF